MFEGAVELKGRRRTREQESVREQPVIEKLAQRRQIVSREPARFDVSTNDLSKLRFCYLSVRAAYIPRLSPPLGLASTFDYCSRPTRETFIEAESGESTVGGTWKWKSEGRRECEREG